MLPRWSLLSSRRPIRCREPASGSPPPGPAAQGVRGDREEAKQEDGHNTMGWPDADRIGKAPQQQGQDKAGGSAGQGRPGTGHDRVSRCRLHRQGQEHRLETRDAQACKGQAQQGARCVARQPEQVEAQAREQEAEGEGREVKAADGIGQLQLALQEGREGPSRFR
jgi:hypothetical protein